MNNLSNARQEGEEFKTYKERLRLTNKGIKYYLRYGTLALAPRCKRWLDVEKAWTQYVSGPHRTHVPKEGIHSGTLFKYTEKLRLDRAPIL